MRLTTRRINRLIALAIACEFLGLILFACGCNAEPVVASRYHIPIGYRLPDHSRYYGGLVVASLSLPFGTKVRLTNPKNARCVHAIVRDRGPYVKGRQLDLSSRVARKLGVWREGVARIDMEIEGERS